MTPARRAIDRTGGRIPAVHAEQARLHEARSGVPWRRWGPYLAERAWGTVREDYSANGDAWGYFSHDDARRRAYRWNEDGLLGISDDEQRLCLALAVWNEQDPIIKERLFGLSNPEGNHGEDVKELYFYLDAVPSSSLLHGAYLYPQRAFPYDDLVAENARRGGADPECELLDTGVMSRVEYEPGETATRLKGGNSNWRGPVWLPINYLLWQSLRQYGRYYGDALTHAHPAPDGGTGSPTDR